MKRVGGMPVSEEGYDRMIIYNILYTHINLNNHGELI